MTCIPSLCPTSADEPPTYKLPGATKHMIWKCYNLVEDKNRFCGVKSVNWIVFAVQSWRDYCDSVERSIKYAITLIVALRNLRH